MASRGGAFVVLVVLCSLPALALQAGAREPLVPAIFVFGDSLVDVGNNNHLPNVNSSCKANYGPYGIDYTDQLPTGRFSNGYNLADELAKWLGFAESPPPFFSPTSARARLTRRRRRLTTSTVGMNFASGGSGLLPQTGSALCGGEVISMADQVGNFTSLVRTWESKERKRVSKSLVFISVGSNDLFEYSDHFADPSNRNAPRNDTEFLQGLIGLYTAYVTELYVAGATKFSIVSPSLLGCCPSQRNIAKDFNITDTQGCLGAANTLSSQLYPMINSMLQDLSVKLPGMKYSLGDAIGMAQYFFNNSNNFTTLDSACCGSGNFNAGACNCSAQVCHGRTSFFFWDRFHPTEAAAATTALQLFTDPGTYVHPINVQQLVASASSRP